jgi:hypothetical protein
MNEKLKGILHTAWNEPRSFFLWLALFSICGFAAAAVGAARIGPTLFLVLVAVACGLCFILSILAFLLAWIPPIRRLFAWLLRRRFLVLGCLATLIALFYTVENWRGCRAWQTYKRDQEAKSERFDLVSLAPPPVPDDQNFFETPLWTDLHFVEKNGDVVWSGTNHATRVIFDAFGPGGSEAPSVADVALGRRVDLAAWQAYYRSTNNLFAAPGGPPTNYFPVAKEPQSAAADVLLALSKFNGNRQLLIEAAARPQARFWINYDAGAGMLLPCLARVKTSEQFVSFHAIAALKAGDRETALEDMKLMFRLLESIRGEPILISHLVRAASLFITLGPVWEGLADRQWAEPDLRVIESELGKLNFLADYELAMRGERACNLWAIDYIRRVGIQGMDEALAPGGETAGPSDWEKSLGPALLRLVPAGWFDQNKLFACHLYEKYTLPAADEARRLVSPAVVRKSDAMQQELVMSPYRFLARHLVPALARAAERCAAAQNFADLARLACALERYRLANGQFPETLEALAPKFIEQLPHDIINGQPLKYHRTEDGQFVLYSVGWNETDDGGKVALTKSGSYDRNHGDWVWRYPPK